MAYSRLGWVQEHIIQLMLFTAILIGGGVFLFATAVFTKFEENFSEKIQASLFFQAAAAADILEEHFFRESDEVDNLAEKIVLAGGDKKAVSSVFSAHFKGEINQGESLTSGVLSDRDGAVLFAYPDNLTDSVPETFLKRLAQIFGQGKHTLGLGFVRLGRGGEMVALSRVVRSPFQGTSRERVPDRYVTVFYSIESITRKYLSSFPAYIIVNSIGQVNFHGWDLEWPKKEFTLSDPDIPPDLKEVGWDLMSGRSGRRPFRHGGSDYLLAYSPVLISLKEDFTDTSPSRTGAKNFLSVGVFQSKEIILKEVSLTKWEFSLLISAFLFVLLTLGGAILLTYRRQAAEEARLYNAQLVTVRETAGGAAHQLFQPLTAIFGNLALIRMILKNNPPDMEEQVLKKLGDIQSESEIITELVDQMKETMEYRTEEYAGKKRITVFTRKKSD